MYRTLNDFFTKWRNESESTLKLFGALNDAALDQRVTPEGRSLRDLAWHITTTLTELPGEAGLTVEGAQHNSPVPTSTEEIIAAYEMNSASLMEALKSNWNDTMLEDPVSMYGDTWTYGVALAALCDHQIHHRGQMTVLMRQAGLRVPGIYGPAREEWAEMGMPAMA